MQKIDYHGWQGCVRLANDLVDVVASTAFGPRVLRFGFTGGENVLGESEEWQGKVSTGDEWVNYGGHRLWHAPEVMPRTYAPDNTPVRQAVMDGRALLLVQEVEPTTRIGKHLRVRVGRNGMPLVRVDHILTNHNPWPIEVAPWALSVVAPGGRVIIPQENYSAHGENDNFLPARPLVLWPFTDMSDPRWTWGRRAVQLRSDASLDEPQKIGVFNSAGWSAFYSANGDLFIKFIRTSELEAGDFTDMGCNFETFTKGPFQELESLGPTELLEPGEQASHTEFWTLFKAPNLPHDDTALDAALQPIVREARELVARAEEMNID
jgi:hypothetical protein